MKHYKLVKQTGIKAYKIIIMMFIFLFGLSFSCRENGETYYIYKSVIGYHTRFLELLNETDYSKTTGKFLDSLSVVKYNKLKINLSAESKEISQYKSAKVKTNFFSAKADNITTRITGTLNNIDIKTNCKYNDKYTAGKVINDIVLIDYQKVNGVYDGPIYLNDFNKEDHPCSGGGFFYLTTPPDTTRTCSFTFIIKHANDSVFKTQSIPITITP
jgi:hypothetical protein